jgi:hypothetical protein
MSDQVSVNKPPRFGGSKFRLVKLCLKTFVKAFEDVKPKIHFLLDRATGEYLDLIKEVCPFEFTHEFSDYGRFTAGLKQYNLAQESEDEVLIFAEDDYLWKEGTGKYFIEAIKELGIVSPYDNPDFYITEPYRSRQEKIKVVNNWHWRTTMSTTMTFGITKTKFMYHRQKFDLHGISDSPLWQDINDIIWIPIPSFATHFVEGKLSPSVDWTKYY